MNTAAVKSESTMPLEALRIARNGSGGVSTKENETSSMSYAEKIELLQAIAESMDLDEVVLDVVRSIPKYRIPKNRYGRMEDARKAKLKMGWTPLTPEEKIEYEKMMDEMLN